MNKQSLRSGELKQSLHKYIKQMMFIHRKIIKQLDVFSIVNLGLFMYQTLYLFYSFKNVNKFVPFWYSKTWGLDQLAPKSALLLIPLTTLFIFISGLSINALLKKYNLRYSSNIITLVVIISNVFLTKSILQIVNISSIPVASPFNPIYFQLLKPFFISAILALLVSPFFIKFAFSKNIVTNPLAHVHPGMVLAKPSARGGGVIFTFVFVAVSLFYVRFSYQTVGIIIGSILLAVFGFVDDIQNTNIYSKLKFLEAPLLRLFLLFLIVGIVTLFGVRIETVGIPFDGVVNFSQIKFFLGGIQLVPVASIITIIWVVWILNLLSWSNGVDGQYSGIIGIAGIVIALLSLRFNPLLPSQENIARMAIILAGASFGLIPYTWHPSKIMWGFGAMSAGMILAGLSVLSTSKIATSVIVLMVPFLDGSVTFVRRILQGKNPLKGDRGHLHHLLLERGWSHKKISLFYWITTAVFGMIGILASDKYIVQITLTLGGVVAFFIILLNLKSISMKQLLSRSER